jgi:spore germination cell wall hydrolase CwlJ-like protein
MDDATLAALCIADEAAGEPFAGKVAVGLVIRHRMAAGYRSDGTVAGTVLAKLQFSGFWCEMEQGHYEEICHTLADAQARAVQLLQQFQAQRLVWGQCVAAWAESGDPASVIIGGNPALAKIKADPRTLLYCNPRLCSPSWATQENLVAVVGQHDFYRG